MQGAACTSMPNFVKIGQAIAGISRFFDFQDGGRPLSWICCAHISTTHEEHSVVFIVVQNLAGRLCSFKYMRISILCTFGWKMPIHAPFSGVLGQKWGETETWCIFIPLRRGVTRGQRRQLPPGAAASAAQNGVNKKIRAIFRETMRAVFAKCIITKIVS